MSSAFTLFFTLSLHEAGDEDISMEEKARLTKMEKIVKNRRKMVYMPFHIK
jgi:hypothetical protein